MSSNKQATSKPELSFTAEQAGSAYRLLANGRPLQTPGGNPLTFPTKELAEKTAAQMAVRALEAPFYRLMSFATDLGHDGKRPALTKELLDHFDTDLVCYYTDKPADLAAMQKENWQPIITWAEGLGITPILTTATTTPLTQPDTARKALQTHLERLSDKRFVVAFIGGKLASSVLTGLALAREHITATTAHSIAHTDELYQQRRYGADEELAEMLKESLVFFEDLARFNHTAR